MSIVEQLNKNDKSDALVWTYEKSGTYSSHSFYGVINYRGVTPIYIPAIWNLMVAQKNLIISLASIP
jgi:hypothetical protein